MKIFTSRSSHLLQQSCSAPSVRVVASVHSLLFSPLSCIKKNKLNRNVSQIFPIWLKVNVCSYMQLVCLAEEVRVDADDISSLFKLTCGDVRRCLLQLQLWVHSGGGYTSQLIGQNHAERMFLFCYSYFISLLETTTAAFFFTGSETRIGGGSDSKLPLVQTGCSAYMLGLHPVTLNYLLSFLKASIYSTLLFLPP